MPKAQSTTTKKTSSFPTTIKRTSKKSPGLEKAKHIHHIASQTEKRWDKVESRRTAGITPPKLKPEGKVPVAIRIFFGCSLLLFCIALYKAILLPKIIQNPSQTQTSLNETEQTLTSTGETILTSSNENDLLPDTSSVGPAFLKEFYQVFSQKDSTNLTSLFDTPLQKSADIRRFFSDYKITPFIDNIENNKIAPYNITLISTSPTGTEEYSYMLNYHLIPGDITFEEERIAKVKYTDNGPKIASIRCESYRCSYNPFFRPESYGLIQ